VKQLKPNKVSLSLIEDCLLNKSDFDKIVHTLFCDCEDYTDKFCMIHVQKVFEAVVLISGVECGTGVCAHQSLHSLRVASRSSYEERSPAIIVGSADVCAANHQRPHRLRVALTSSYELPNVTCAFEIQVVANEMSDIGECPRAEVQN
jgi:hypothetical protein